VSTRKRGGGCCGGCCGAGVGGGGAWGAPVACARRTAPRAHTRANWNTAHLANRGLAGESVLQPDAGLAAQTGNRRRGLRRLQRGAAERQLVRTGSLDGSHDERLVVALGVQLIKHEENKVHSEWSHVSFPELIADQVRTLTAV